VGNGEYYIINFVIDTPHLVMLGSADGRNKKMYKILIWKPLEKQPLGRSRTMGR
jgi:hypothetical protein